jgi:flagellar biosynthesis anti-sigma factor FlgM
MGKKIVAYGRPEADVRNARKRQASKQSSAEASEPRNLPLPAPAAVDLPDLAKLRRIAGRLRQTFDIDAERVAEVRARIEAGEYQIDARRVADKLARLERDLS